MLSNKYSACYFRIIDRARPRAKEDGYERHHIIPVSLGGSNRKINLVYLTLKEHFICHLLLLKMTEGADKQKMSAAFVLMAGRKRGKMLTGKLYEAARAGLSERTRQQWQDPDHRVNVTEKLRTAGNAKVAAGWVPPWAGKPRSEENRKAIGDAQRGKSFSEERKAKHRKPCIFNGVEYATFGEARDAHPKLRHNEVTWVIPVTTTEEQRRSKISGKLGTRCIFDGVEYASIRQANLVAKLGQAIKTDPRFSFVDVEVCDTLQPSFS